MNGQIDFSWDFRVAANEKVNQVLRAEVNDQSKDAEKNRQHILDDVGQTPRFFASAILPVIGKCRNKRGAQRAFRKKIAQ